MNSNSGGKFRKKRTNFSMVSNDIIRNDKVSLKAKGLYALIALSVIHNIGKFYIIQRIFTEQMY